MAKVLLGIMILFMAMAPIAHGYLAFKFNALQTLLPEEETHDEKPQSKSKSDIKDYLLLSLSHEQQLTGDNLKSSCLHHLPALSKGYAGIPLMPPKVN